MDDIERPAEQELEYAGFWIRVWASLIDSVLAVLVIVPLVGMLYGWDRLGLLGETMQGPSSYLADLLLAVAIIAFWVAKSATPGKMAIHAKIVSAKTGGTPSKAQFIVRYLGYYVSTIPLGLGLIWVAFDPRKQGWHDKLAGTVVVRPKGGGTQPVKFG